LVLSATFTANESVAALVGVPVNKPDVLKEKPVTALVNVQVYLPLPPVAASCCEHATFTVAAGSVVVVMLTGVALVADE